MGLSDFRQQKRPTLSVTLSWFSEDAIYNASTGTSQANNDAVASNNHQYTVAELAPSETVVTARDVMGGTYSIIRNMGAGISSRMANFRIVPSDASQNIQSVQAVSQKAFFNDSKKTHNMFDSDGDVWFQYSHSRNSIDYGSGRESKASQNDIELGIDFVKQLEKDKFVYGMSIDVNNANVTFTRGKADVDGIMASVYGEYIRSDGQFFDATIQAGKISNETQSYLDKGVFS